MKRVEYVTGPRIDEDCIVSTYSTLQSTSILGPLQQSSSDSSNSSSSSNGGGIAASKSDPSRLSLSYGLVLQRQRVYPRRVEEY